MENYSKFGAACLFYMFVGIDMVHAVFKFSIALGTIAELHVGIVQLRLSAHMAFVEGNVVDDLALCRGFVRAAGGIDGLGKFLAPSPGLDLGDQLRPKEQDIV